jgi:asparagine N-glycosylation enzyme membrane subunit Stt3
MWMNDSFRRWVGTARVRYAVGVFLVFAAAAAARFATWHSVFTQRGVRFAGDADVLYHVFRAERLLRGEADAAWFDANIDFPNGAAILWPPGFDALLAGLTRVFAGPDAGRTSLEAVAAVTPVLLAFVSLGLLMLLAARLANGAAALVAGLVFAVLPVCVEFGTVGRPDHHVAELTVFLFAVLALMEAERKGGRGAWPLALGMSLTVAPWVWQGSTLHLLFVAAATGGAWLLQPAGRDAALAAVRTARTAAFVAAPVLAGSILCLAPPGALSSTSLGGLSAFHPTALLAVGVISELLLRIGTSPSLASLPRRSAVLALTAAVGAIAVLTAAPDAVRHGLSYLVRGDPLLETIAECQPALLGNRSRIARDASWLAFGFGPALLSPAFAIPAARRLWSDRPQARHPLFVVATGAAIFLVLVLGRAVRFHLYLTPFLALLSGLSVGHLLQKEGTRSSRDPGRFGLAIAAVVALILPGAAAMARSYGSAADETTISVLHWMRDSGAGRTRSVAADWALGHAVQYYAGLPVLTTNFGTDVGDAGIRDSAAFLYAPSPEAAEAIVLRRRIGYVLLSGRLDPIADARAFAPPGAPELVQAFNDYWGDGRFLRTVPAYGQSIPGWLYEYDGVPLQEGRPAGLAFLRLVMETSGSDPLKVFEAVKGATLEVSGAQPGASIAAHVDVVTNQGRTFHWWTPAWADTNGNAVVRLPYSTGMNGSSVGSAYRLRVARAIQELTVSEHHVLSGDVIHVDVSGTRAVEAAPRSTGDSIR